MSVRIGKEKKKLREDYEVLEDEERRQERYELVFTKSTSLNATIQALIFVCSLLFTVRKSTLIFDANLMDLETNNINRMPVFLITQECIPVGCVPAAH